MLEAAFKSNWYNKLVRFEPYSKELLKKLISEKRMTIEDLSVDSGIPLSTLKKWTSGHSQPNLDGIIKLGRYFNVFLYGDWTQSESSDQG